MSTSTKRPPEISTPPETPAHPTDVGDVMLHVKSVLRLAKSVAHCQLGEVAEVDRDAFYALADLLEDTAAELEAAYDRYCTESNALHAAAESGGDA